MNFTKSWNESNFRAIHTTVNLEFITQTLAQVQKYKCRLILFFLLWLTDEHCTILHLSQRVNFRMQTIRFLFSLRSFICFLSRPRVMLIMEWPIEKWKIFLKTIITKNFQSSAFFRLTIMIKLKYGNEQKFNGNYFHVFWASEE